MFFKIFKLEKFKISRNLNIDMKKLIILIYVMLYKVFKKISGIVCIGDIWNIVILILYNCKGY